MNAPTDESFDQEFQIRYRFPRPISRAYEAVCFAVNREEMAQRSRWCARVALQFLAVLKQAAHLAASPEVPVNAPTSRDLRLGRESRTTSEGRRGHNPLSFAEVDHHPLLRLVEGRDRHRVLHDPTPLREALAGFLPLSRYRLVVLDGARYNVLLGPRMEYTVAPGPPASALEGLPAGTPLIVDPADGRFLSLAPLVVWQKQARSSFGRLFVLTRLSGLDGHYVEAGIPGCPGSGARLDGRPQVGRLPVARQVLEAIHSPPARFRDGERLEDYGHVFGLIWRGGTSDVFAARRRVDSRLVALKTYEDEAGVFDENFWRFLSEERLSQLIRHPGVVTSFRLAGGQWGFVHEQELARRGSLNDLLLTNGVLRPDRAVEVARQLLETLDAVHGQGVVHNDVKPDNILFDEDGSLKLIDFGISVRREPDRDRLRPGAPAGSPGYVAPEVKRGDWPRVESDLYAVGVVLREMLVGAVGDERGADLGAVGPEETRGIPAALEPVLARLLAEEPEQRYPSAHAGAAALHEAREGLVLEHAVTLDVEGTLVPSFRDRRPREGLAEFMTFCLDHFDRIFVYTLLAREEARDVFEELAGWHPAAARFLDRYEYVAWPRGEDGSLKDLRRCRVALEQNALVDDMIEWVPEDQAHRWVKVQNCDDVAGFDRGLAHAEQTLRGLFGLADAG